MTSNQDEDLEIILPGPDGQVINLEVEVPVIEDNECDDAIKNECDN